MVSKTKVRDWKRPAAIGYAIIFLAFGVCGAWAAVAQLDSAVVATGTVSVESNRKTISHLEGGIVREIFVREGQHVENGELLLRLEDTQARASTEMYHNQLMAAVAQEARLIAERDRATEVVFPAELVADEANPVSKAAMKDQRKQFEARRTSIEGQVSILQAKIKALYTEIDGLTAEQTGAIHQRQFIEQELVDMRMLGAKNLVPKTRVLALERENSRLEGAIGKSTADQAKSNATIGEARLQIEQLQQKFAEDVNTSLLETRGKIADFRERARVTKDVLRRVDIYAPRAGTVQNVKVSTVGGVIRPGEPLLELIPDSDQLIVTAQVSPADVDSIRAPEQAEVRFNAFHGKILPIIMGKVESLSRDRLIDEQTRAPYFLARISVDVSQLPSEIRDRITAGMPVEVIIPTGERTMADYLIRPLRNRMSKALREK